MLKRKMLYSAACMSVLAASLLAGCSSSGGGGTTSTTTAITTPSADGNVQASIGSVTINSPPVVTFALSDEKGQPLDPTTSGLTVRFHIAKIGADGNYQNYIGNSSGQPTSDSGGTFATVSPGVYTYTFKTDIKDTTKTLNGLAFDPTQTHTVSAQIVRTVIVNGKSFQQASNPYFNFRPDGQAVTVTREVVSISACNECHGKLGVHGGGRREIALCILCHNPGAKDPDTGNSVDMKDLIHKIHMGKNLPSFKTGKASYGIIGFGNGFNSYSTVSYPLMSGDGLINNTPINCDKCHKKGTDTFGRSYGKDVAKYTNPTRSNCTTCHDMTTFDGTTKLTFNNATKPAAGAKGPFKPYSTTTNVAVPHTGGPQSDDSKCSTASCHGGKSKEYDTTSITGAHTVFEKSTKFPGLNFKINSVKLQRKLVGGVDSIQPIVNFSVTDNTGKAVNPLDNTSTTGVASFNLKFGFMVNGNYVNAGVDNGGNAKVGGVDNSSWPAPGQPATMPLNTANSANANLEGYVPTPKGDGSYDITFSPLKAAAGKPQATLVRGSVVDAILLGGGDVKGVVSMEGTYTYGFAAPLTGHHTSTTVRVGGKSDQYYFDLNAAGTLTGTPVDASRLIKARRQSVDQSKCEVCHSRVSLHGGNRIDVEECVICHNPNATDKAKRTPTSLPWPDGLAEQTIDLKVMIHRIHTGKNLNNSYIINSPSFDTSKFGYPNEMIECKACHIQDNPFDNNAFDTAVTNGTRLVTPATGTGAYDPTSTDILSGRSLPYVSVCTSCHDASGLVAAGGHINQNLNNQCATCHTSSFIGTKHQPTN